MDFQIKMPRTINLKGLYQHGRNRQLYQVLGLGRSVEIPQRFMVVYKQMNEVTENGITYPKGFIWTQSIQKFRENNLKIS